MRSWFCWMVVFWVFGSTQVWADGNSEALKSELAALTQTKLKDTIAVLQQLEERHGEALLPTFKFYLAGQLYFVKANKRLITVEKVGAEKFYKDLFDQASLPAFEKKAIKKIRLNNKIRTHLRQAIARLQLSNPEASLRLASVKSLLGKVDESMVITLQKLAQDETHGKVKSAMDLAINLYHAEFAEGDEQTSAVIALGSSLEPQVRVKLTELQNKELTTDLAKQVSTSLTAIENKTRFYNRLDTLFFGLSLGSVLLLAAVGLAITFGVMGVINMAHGEMIMLGAYTTYVVQLLLPNHVAYSIWLAIPLAFTVSALVGMAIERGVIRFLHGRPLETLLATFGISLILQQTVRTLFSPLNRQVSTPEWMSGSIELNPVLSLTLNRLYIFLFALIVFALLVLILKKTALGLQVRAVSQNRAMAKAMGIRTERVDALTFGLGSGIAGIAGVALSQLTNVGPNLGQAYIIDSFMVVVFGGVGNLFGTFTAAFTLGIANKFLEPVTGAVLASIFVLVFIILFIQKSPKGLFPQKGRAAE